MAIRTRSILSHPPGVKPQRPLKPEIKQLLQMQNYKHTLQHKRTLTDIHSTQKYMQEKLLLFILNGKCLFVQGVPEHGL
jgi:hypothetical protein